jgi:hypothetical protein
MVEEKFSHHGNACLKINKGTNNIISACKIMHVFVHIGTQAIKQDNFNNSNLLNGEISFFNFNVISKLSIMAIY